MAKSKENTAQAAIKATIKPMAVGDVTLPHLAFKGKAPSDGDTVTAEMENGSVYSCVVAAAIEADGEIIVQPVDGLKLINE
ncbi:hypothetical protein [Tateyamaria sp.]|uniref:hypothetical protein n=1 Tax=Tateyamaria sp. TaxID=1929288 RepID=UPI003B2230EE